MFQIFMTKPKIPQNATNFSKMAEDDDDYYEKLFLRPLDAVARGQKLSIFLLSTFNTIKLLREIYSNEKMREYKKILLCKQY